LFRKWIILVLQGRRFLRIGTKVIVKPKILFLPGSLGMPEPAAENQCAVSSLIHLGRHGDLKATSLLDCGKALTQAPRPGKQIDYVIGLQL
jgi:hypothetical protein